MKMRFALTTGLVVASLMAPAAQQSTPPAPNPSAALSTSAAPAREEWSVTDHTIKLGGQTIPYKAGAGTTILKDDKGEPTGLLYSVAYTRSDVKDPSERPIAFLYNGGPGSATMWLHMGGVGPRRGRKVRGGVAPAPAHTPR